jgi:hypothetical protein
VVAQEENKEIFGSIFEEETQAQVAPALEKPVAQLANANPAMAMRLAEGVRQLDEGQQAFDAIPLFRDV